MEMKNCAVGFARLDVTPQLGVQIGGYFTKRYGKGVLDPLYVRALAFRVEENTAVLLVLDQCSMRGKFGSQWPADIAQKLGLGSHTNMVLQAAFFRLAEIMPLADALEHMKAAVRKTYLAKGEDVIQKNIQAIDAGVQEVKKVTVPDAWLEVLEKEADNASDLPEVSEVELLECPSVENPYGVKGVGEMTPNVVCPAIVNAVYDAIGVRFTSVPISPDKVLAALNV